MKKLSIILAVVMCVAALMSLFACDSTSGEYEINYDIDLGQKRDLSVLMPYSGYEIGTVNNSLTAQTIERLTGYKTTYTQLPAADASKTLNNELMDKRPYDAIKLTKDQFADLVKDDMLVDLTDALKKFAPDMLSSISEESWGVVTVNGKIYGIPERASSDNIENPIVFNNDLMLQCNLDLPTTLAEFENVLKVLTEKIGRPALTFDRYTPLVFGVGVLNLGIHPVKHVADVFRHVVRHADDVGVTARAIHLFHCVCVTLQGAKIRKVFVKGAACFQFGNFT